jgi:hypothetical protein
MDEKQKFLERNRVAASKYRQKKKEWTNNLERRARELQAHKTRLTLLVGSLKEEMLFLQREVSKHDSQGVEKIRIFRCIYKLNFKFKLN